MQVTRNRVPSYFRLKNYNFNFLTCTFVEEKHNESISPRSDSQNLHCWRLKIPNWRAANPSSDAEIPIPMAEVELR